MHTLLPLSQSRDPGEISIITTEDGSHSLFNSTLNETYHSIHGAIQESRHVFIDAGLKAWLENNTRTNVRIFEVGFGTGLNAFLTAIYSSHLTNIYYESWEAYPVDEKLIEQLNYHLALGSKETFEEIQHAAWNNDVSISDRFMLHKHQGDLIYDEIKSASFDIIYYDAFGPSKQPAMWDKQVLEKVVDRLVPNGVFVTYCAKGQVKRDLKSLGLFVETLPGPPGKLQMIRAGKTHPRD